MPVYDAGTDDAGRPWVVMELVLGETLADALRRGPLEPVRTAEVGRVLAEALAHVHAEGLVHRDVKPANVLLGRDGRVRLTDFGIARLVDAARVTATGLTVGTAGYLSPEQVTGSHVGPPSDVYSLGLVLLECLTGAREYPGTAVEVALARLSRQPRVPADLPAGWPGLLEAMTAREPAGRPTAGEVATELTRIAMGGEATTVLAATPAAEHTQVLDRTALLTRRRAGAAQLGARGRRARRPRRSPSAAARGGAGRRRWSACWSCSWSALLLYDRTSDDPGHAAAGGEPLRAGRAARGPRAAEAGDRVVRIRTALAGVAVGGLLLTGCAASPQAELNEATTELVERANDGDADGVRSAADALAAVVRRQAGDPLDAAEVERLLALIADIREEAGLLEEEEPEPTPEPTTEEPTVEPTTEAPTTEPPTVEPTTEEPTTEPPTTEPPTTEPPTDHGAADHRPDHHRAADHRRADADPDDVRQRRRQRRQRRRRRRQRRGQRRQRRGQRRRRRRRRRRHDDDGDADDTAEAAVSPSSSPSATPTPRSTPSPGLSRVPPDGPTAFVLGGRRAARRGRGRHAARPARGGGAPRPRAGHQRRAR